MAISKYDQFDFLIDIVPREELKPKKEEKPVQQEQYVYLVNQQTPQQSQHPVQTISTIPTITHSPNTQTIQLQQTPNGLQATTSPQQHQQIMISQPAQNQNQLQQVQQTVPGLIQIPSGGNQIQIVQQVMSPNGEIQQIPVSSLIVELNKVF